MADGPSHASPAYYSPEEHKPYENKKPQIQSYSKCHRTLNRAARQLFRQDAAPILLHYFGGIGQDAPWRRTKHNEPTLYTEIDDSVDKRGRKRQRIPLVDDPYDGLADEEWNALLSYAIGISSSNANSKPRDVCPLHPKHDILLLHEQNSFIIPRRYRTGKAVTKYGGLSLPLTGRAARSALWLEERKAYGQQNNQLYQRPKKIGYYDNSVYLFQCGICEKTFVSRYYLDKHMGAHHHHDHHRDHSLPSQAPESVLASDIALPSSSNNLSDTTPLCPADHLCDFLGGISVCAETMNQISPYYGRGTLLGKEYIIPSSDSLFSSSIHSLISHLYPGDDDELDSNAESQEQKQHYFGPHNKKNRKTREGDFQKITGDMRHRSYRRNQLMAKAFEAKQQSNQQILETFEADKNTRGNDDDWISSSSQRHSDSSSCDNEEMREMFNKCRDVMKNCFGDELTENAEEKYDSGNDPHNLATDLITQLCQPLHCHHRLHRMAGHNPRHIVQWNDQWEEHHKFSLGVFGWMVVVGIVLFYGCAFVLGFGGDRSALPSHGEKKKKKKI